MAEHDSCKHSDKDSAALVCGHPLPCPHHTVVLEKKKMSILIIGSNDVNESYTIYVSGAEPKSNNGKHVVSGGGGVFDLVNRFITGYEKDDII